MVAVLVIFSFLRPLGWCTAQWKMLLFCTKTMGHAPEEEEEEERKKEKNILAVWRLSGSVLSQCFLAPLGAWVVRHENTRR